MISPLVSLRCSLFAYLNNTDLVHWKFPEILAGIGGGISKKQLSAYKSTNISETRQDRTKVTIEVQ